MMLYDSMDLRFPFPQQTYTSPTPNLLCNLLATPVARTAEEELILIQILLLKIFVTSWFLPSLEEFLVAMAAIVMTVNPKIKSCEATAKDVMNQVTKTQKVLEKHGPLAN